MRFDGFEIKVILADAQAQSAVQALRLPSDRPRWRIFFCEDVIVGVSPRTPCRYRISAQVSVPVMLVLSQPSSEANWPVDRPPWPNVTHRDRHTCDHYGACPPVRASVKAGASSSSEGAS
jgi:hypothetical protein